VLLWPTATGTCGLRPRCVAFDGWYGSLDNLKLVGSLG